ncbi:copper amine oxidase N-terminal domain-containing protein [Paenibacillus eucommiae]|uniref:Cytochrome c556 n=1 Tax=Paenibacillus eucommiae TaxID=1355755 RepID=A0ABS4J9U3_9BACL|nr:copper amine oxidase N-terminal domain-containing protein [Paenibacillus eucommiae]MBP1996016.1 cytochrome c556 [Paenibacillus eucommiae]
MKKVVTKIVLFALCLTLLIPALASAAVPSTEGSKANLRSKLGNILGEHALLAVIAMQKGYDKAGDFDQAAAALLENSDSLTAAIASVYGEEAGEAFKPIWNSHIGYLVDYVKATVAGDEPGRTKAFGALDSYSVEQARFFAKANPNLVEADVTNDLRMHIRHLLAAFSAYVNKDYTEVYNAARTAYAHMYMTADGLTAAIVKQNPDKYPQGDATETASTLRSVLERTLGEHGILAALAMQKGFSGAADFDQAAAALLKNSDELTAGISTIYGEAAGDAFKPIWNSHIGYLVDYVKATAAKDETKRQKAVSDLEEYRTKQAKFFADANPNFKENQIAEGLKMHIGHLLESFNAYASNNTYSTAYAKLRTTYAHMAMTGNELAGGVVAQFPELFSSNEQPSTEPPTSQKDVIVFTEGSRYFTNDGESVAMDITPEVVNGKVFLPLRYLAEALGATVSWDPTDRSATTITIDDTTAVFWIDNNIMQLNGTSKDVGSIVHLYGERTVVPAQFLADLFGWDLTWNSAKGTITLTEK